MHLSFLNKSPTVNNKQINHSWLPASDTDSIFFPCDYFEQVLHDLWMIGPSVQIKNTNIIFLYKYYVRMSWKAPNQSRQLFSTYTVNGRYCTTSKNIRCCLLFEYSQNETNCSVVPGKQYRFKGDLLFISHSNNFKFIITVNLKSSGKNNNKKYLNKKCQCEKNVNLTAA